MYHKYRALDKPQRILDCFTFPWCPPWKKPQDVSIRRIRYWPKLPRRAKSEEATHKVDTTCACIAFEIFWEIARECSRRHEYPISSDFRAKVTFLQRIEEMENTRTITAVFNQNRKIITKEKEAQKREKLSTFKVFLVKKRPKLYEHGTSDGSRRPAEPKNWQLLWKADLTQNWKARKKWLQKRNIWSQKWKRNEEMKSKIHWFSFFTFSQLASENFTMPMWSVPHTHLLAAPSSRITHTLTQLRGMHKSRT